MLKFVQAVESVLLTSDNVQSSYDLEYQSLHDTQYKYVGLFLSDDDDNKLHDLADELAISSKQFGKQLGSGQHCHVVLASNPNFCSIHRNEAMYRE